MNGTRIQAYEAEGAAALLTPSELERVAAAVQAAEAHTSGEIATMVVLRSDRYLEAELLGGVLLAAFLAFVGSLLTAQVTIWWYLPLVLVLFYPALWLIHRFPVLKRPFISHPRLEEAVRERAVRAFFEKGLHRTKGESGILIFISVFEHKVWILGDRGIDQRIPPESWRELAGTLSSGIRAGKACESLCSVIASCGETLARHFPRAADDVNELPDTVL